MKHIRLVLCIVTVALFSAAAWADGIDPKVIPLGGTGSTPITITHPNPTVTATAVGPSAANDFCLGAPACVDDVFQNRTPGTLTSLTMFFSAASNPGLVFGCGDMTQALFFDNCTPASVSGVNPGEDIIFRADGRTINDVTYNGVAPAVFECVPDLDGDDDGKLGCNADDFTWVGGEFAIVIYANNGDLAVGHKVTTQAITTPEPGAGLMVLFGALAFALFKLVRRAA